MISVERLDSLQIRILVSGQGVEELLVEGEREEILVRRSLPMWVETLRTLDDY
jgi:hypothetical protein